MALLGVGGERGFQALAFKLGERGSENAAVYKHGIALLEVGRGLPKQTRGCACFDALIYRSRTNALEKRGEDYRGMNYGLITGSHITEKRKDQATGVVQPLSDTTKGLTVVWTSGPLL